MIYCTLSSLTYSLLLATGCCCLRLVLAAHLLHAVLCIFLATSASTRLFATKAGPLQAILGLKFLHLVLIFIDEAEATAATSAKICVQTKDHDASGVVNLVHRSQLRRKVLLGDICQSGVDDVEYKLFSPQEWVLLELARADCEITHCHCWSNSG